MRSAGGAGGASGSDCVITIGAAAALAAGYLWVALGEIVWLDVAGLMRWTLLTVHAWIGLVLVPLVVVHLLPRRWRLLRPASGSIDRAAVAAPDAPIRARRWRPAGCGGRYPRRCRRVSSWSAAASAGSPARAGCRPAASRRRPRSSASPPRRSTLPAGACASAIARSRSTSCAAWARPPGRPCSTAPRAGRSRPTGRACRWPRSSRPRASRSMATSSFARRPAGPRSCRAGEAADCLLAWGCAGADLPAGNGAPLRLVAPGHRGLDWVKWVAEIEPVRAG